MKYIQLTQGKKTMVDDRDYEYLSQFKWFYSNRYAKRAVSALGKQHQVRMHRIISGANENDSVDHINGDTLDNRSANLRLCNNDQNQQNRRIPKNNTSGYKGVSWLSSRKKWRVYVGGKLEGYFDSKIEAAKTYNRVARERFGEFARLNSL